MQIFKTKRFAHSAKRKRIADDSLSYAIERAERGDLDTDLGGGVIEQYVPRERSGVYIPPNFRRKRLGYQVLIAYRSGHRAVFLYGFALNKRAIIKDDELATLREIAAVWLKAGADRLEDAIEEGILREVKS